MPRSQCELISNSPFPPPDFPISGEDPCRKFANGIWKEHQGLGTLSW
eukprot:jgi/Botrbrau1/5460/Bobra.27_1s0011.1